MARLSDTTRLHVVSTVCLVFLLLTLGVTLVRLVRDTQRARLECEVRERLNWQHIPEAMAAMAQREAEQDAALQVALDTHRATSWWAWLTTPAHPPKRGCDTWGLL